MGRKIVVVALFCFVVVGLAFAADKAPAEAPKGHNDHNEGAATDVPEAEGDGFAVAGPVGGPVPDGAFEDAAAAGSSTTTADAMAPGHEPGESGAASLEFSAALAGLAAVSGLFFF
ncbi:hypothetical protein Dimus_031941 [Dionaea muscipula]